MATLNDADYTQIALFIRNDATIRQTFKTLSFSKATWKALFQAAETWFVDALTVRPATSFEAALDAVAQVTTVQARQIAKIWFIWRISTSNW